MKYSKIIALSAISAAITVVLLALGSFIEAIDIACVMIAGLAMMLPLSKKMYLGAFLSYVASALLILIISPGKWNVIVPYAVFFGLYPIGNAVQVRFKINRIIALIVKDAWFLLAMFLYYKMLVFVTGYDLLTDFAFIPDEYSKYIAPGLFAIGAVFFIFYDYVMMRMQRVVDYLVEKIKL